MNGLQALRPILRLFFRTKGAALYAGIAAATVTVLAGIALLGLSGWFITATAIAGLSVATAIVFDVFAPAAGIRFLAIVRTGARYLERLVTHDATLAILAALREKLFRSWARPAAANALLKRPARLLFRLTADIDALDSLYLRVVVPIGAALATALVAGLALALMHPLFGLAVALVLLIVGLSLPLLAARRSEKPMRRRAKGTEALRARTVDLVAGQTELLMAGQMVTSLRLTARSTGSRSGPARASVWHMPDFWLAA
jgi:ATP-binding cassette, subfamily C, bacterial CydC